MIIPWEQLSPQALHGLLAEFATRDGTDYGAVEVSLEKKISDLEIQLRKGDIVIAYDQDTGTSNLVGTHDL